MGEVLDSGVRGAALEVTARRTGHGHGALVSGTLVSGTLVSGTLVSGTVSVVVGAVVVVVVLVVAVVVGAVVVGAVVVVDAVVGTVGKVGPVGGAVGCVVLNAVVVVARVVVVGRAVVGATFAVVGAAATVPVAALRAGAGGAVVRAGRRTEVARTVVRSVVGGLGGGAATVDGIVVASGGVDDVPGSSVRTGKSSPRVVVDVEVVDGVSKRSETGGPDFPLSEEMPSTSATAAAKSPAPTRSARGISRDYPPGSARQPSRRRFHRLAPGLASPAEREAHDHDTHPHAPGEEQRPKHAWDRHLECQHRSAPLHTCSHEGSTIVGGRDDLRNRRCG